MTPPNTTSTNTTNAYSYNTQHNTQYNNNNNNDNNNEYNTQYKQYNNDTTDDLFF